MTTLINPTIQSLTNDLKLAGHDAEYLEIMVEDLMRLVKRLREDVQSESYGDVIPRRQSWAEGRYAATVERSGRFSEHGPEAEVERKAALRRKE